MATYKIQYRRSTAAVAAASNPVLAMGEPGMETDTGKEKLGDGVTAWNALPYKINTATANATYGARLSLSNLTRPRAVPLVMATPPTVVQGVSGGASTITTPVFIGALDPRLSQLNAGGQSFSLTYPYTTVIAASNNYPNPNLPALTGTPIAAGANYAYSVAFGFDGLKLEFQFLGLWAVGQYQVRVDGQRVAMDPIACGVNTGDYFLTAITFATAKPRFIQIDLTYMPFGGLNIGSNDSVWPVKSGPRALWFGDSFVDGAGPMTAIGSMATTASDLLGWGEWFPSGLGGTGYISPGSFVRFIDRIATDIIPWNPDIVVFAGGHNDIAYTSGQVQTRATDCFNAVKAGLPKAVIIALGPLPSSPSNATGLTAVRDGIKAAALAVPGVVYVETLGAAPVFGMNLPTYVQGDAVHPTQAGANFLGYQLASRISAALQAIG